MLDRSNGKLLSATQFAQKVNWASGIDMKTGRPSDTEMTKSVRANVESSAGAVDQIGERVERMRVQARADCVSESSVAVEEIAKTIESLDALIMSRTAAIAGVTDRTGELLSSMDAAVGRFRT